MKKYKLTNNKKDWFGKTLYQIESLIDFGDIHVGDVGGYVEKEKNLSQEGDARVCGDAWVYGNARVCGDAWVCDNAQVYGNAWVCDNAQVYGNARVYGDARVYGNARVCGDAWVCDNAQVYGNARVYGDAQILWISKIGSRLGTTTAFKNKDGGITISCGCFLGSLAEFEKKVEQTHGNSKYGKEYKALIELIKIHFEVENGQTTENATR